MAEVQIYKLDLTAGDILQAGAYSSVDHGGASAPLAGYPEIFKLENIQRRENFGAGGQHVLDAVNTGDYTTAWINLCEVGNQALGQYDCRGGGPGSPLKCRWKQHFNSASLDETGIRYALVLTHGLVGGADHPSAIGNLYLEIQALQDAGANFDWFCRYRKVSGTFTTMTGTNIFGSADVADDLEHELILTMVPSTVTGAYDGVGFLGSAVVAADGSIVLTVDGVTVLSASGLQFVINHLATTNPEVYFGRGVWHGNEASLFGYISDTELYYETTGKQPMLRVA